MYAIVQIVYGFPLVSNEERVAISEDLEDCIDNEAPGFLSYYSGGANEMPAAFGVELGAFDEACAFVEVKELPLTPSEDAVREFWAAWDALPPTLRNEIATKFGSSPRVFFLWSTS